jgi:hypothetical protein
MVRISNVMTAVRAWRVERRLDQELAAREREQWAAHAKQAHPDSRLEKLAERGGGGTSMGGL